MGNSYAFYEVMKYPLPRYKEFFAYAQEPVGLIGWDEHECSWELDERMQDYIQFIKKRLRLWKRMPFVEEVYLGNSITFNALHEGSDIDLFVVTTDRRLRHARLVSNVVLLLLGLKRIGRRVQKKFCLSFYVTTQGRNLLSIKKKPVDPYLIYRMAHLVPIYFHEEIRGDSIWEENSRVQGYLPNFPLRAIINLGIEPSLGKVRIVQRRERMMNGWIGECIEHLIKIIRLPILFIKRRRLGKKGADIIISDTMLKFHADKRRKYQLLWKLGEKLDKSTNV